MIFRFLLEFGRNPSVYTFSAGGRYLMSDFGKRRAEEIREMERQQEEAEKQATTENAAFVEREQLKRKLGPRLWHNFREMIVSKCEETNKELGKEYYRYHDELPNKLHIIQLNPRANLHLEFVPDAHRIRFCGGPCEGEYLIGIDSSSGQAILSNANQDNFSLEPTAEHLLTECLAKSQI